MHDASVSTFPHQAPLFDMLFGGNRDGFAETGSARGSSTLRAAQFPGSINRTPENHGFMDCPAGQDS